MRPRWGQPMVLWVDDVCINQIDNVEKGQQVVRMGQVYKLARCVRVWLGEPRVHGTLQHFHQVFHAFKTLAKRRSELRVDPCWTAWRLCSELLIIGSHNVQCEKARHSYDRRSGITSIKAHPTWVACGLSERWSGSTSVSRTTAASVSRQIPAQSETPSYMHLEP